VRPEQHDRMRDSTSLRFLLVKTPGMIFGQI
jgi:hypothetical protein